jgi:membrane protein DedA with SNARE-associated domain
LFDLESCIKDFGLKMDGIFEEIKWIVGILAGTFVSEDITCLSTGALIETGRIHWAVGLGACLAGTLLGDILLWGIGRFGRDWAVRRRILQSHRPDDPVLKQLHEHAWFAIAISRFVPGTRLALYVTAGALGFSFAYFAFWTFVAAAIWTPLMVLGGGAFASLLSSPMLGSIGLRGPYAVIAIISVYVLVRLGMKAWKRVRAK